MRALTVGVVLMVLSTFAIGCATYRAGPESKRALNWDDQEQLGIIELDDQGWLHDRENAGFVLDQIAAIAAKGPTNIVVFVHGWHHNANPDDCNRQSFKRVLVRLRQEMDVEVYRQARQELVHNPDVQVVGLYIGWRGRSLPSCLDYATFWDRKPAAERVGHGDLPEVLARLATIYKDGNAHPRRSYTGLVTIGHSFGGDVVFSAVSDVLKARVEEAFPLSASQPTPVPRVDGFGDLVVLINPACEASLYNTIDARTRHARFDAMQAPVMMIVSSEADFPNHRLFAIGRFLSVLHEPLGSHEQYWQKLSAMGWYTPQLTHCLALDGGPGCGGAPAKVVHFDLTKPRGGPPPTVAREAASHCPEADAITFDKDAAIRNAGQWTPQSMLHPETIKLAGELNTAGTRFYPTDPSIDPNNPFVVVKATCDVSGNHNDMFNPNLVNFLIRYAAGAQLKRLAARLESASPH